MTTPKPLKRSLQNKKILRRRGVISAQFQQGVTLLEMLVGLIIGLLVVAVAMGALMVSRSVTGTVSDASGIQQQGSHILRVVGSQLRQAGSLYLNPNPTAASSSANERG